MLDERCVNEEFGRELRIRMAADNIRSGDMSRYCQMSSSQMSKCRNGQLPVNPWHLVLMAEYLDCSVDELLGYEKHVEVGRTKASSAFPGENHYAEFLSNRIVQRMNSECMNIDELSRHIRVSTDIVARWFSRWPTLPRSMQLVKIADTLGCTPSELLGY